VPSVAVSLFDAVSLCILSEPSSSSSSSSSSLSLPTLGALYCRIVFYRLSSFDPTHQSSFLGCTTCTNWMRLRATPFGAVRPLARTPRFDRIHRPSKSTKSLYVICVTLPYAFFGHSHMVCRVVASVGAGHHSAPPISPPILILLAVWHGRAFGFLKHNGQPSRQCRGQNSIETGIPGAAPRLYFGSAPSPLFPRPAAAAAPIASPSTLTCIPFLRCYRSTPVTAVRYPRLIHRLEKCGGEPR